MAVTIAAWVEVVVIVVIVLLVVWVSTRRHLKGVALGLPGGFGFRADFWP